MAEPSALSAEDLAVYRAILLHRQHDVGRLAERLSVSEAEIRASVERLVALSMLRPSWEHPDTVRAVSPQIGLELVLQREQQELALRQERIGQTRAALDTLAAEYSAYEESSGYEGSELLLGIDRIRTRLETLASECAEEVLSFLPGGALPTEAIEAGQPLNEKAMLRGVRFRSLYLQSITKDRATYRYVRRARQLGSEVRLAPTLPMRLLVVDRETAVIPGDPVSARATALVIRSAPVVRALHALFEAHWKDAELFEEPPGRPFDGISAQERELLRLLADGEKDEVVARQLGVSVRTERRMVAEMLSRIDARSRFELGVKAARLGWV
ncbi:helix-turn-helix transcriptional regulator [Streptomyces sp. S.PNR 29]|uniref:helix-turn-helix transcriptional regulator n=1 Tax=Streptomyces sp. S.PNR 29 TaxID=2973805 RepID=UPI0025AF0408|nr:helix-turn-helix transcriptional regulator [Streptomyces sp. S.PNR 29]MDN0201083.1 helix-turn-helix transcriptional regulator [Streptomyces sp. S.PNR 29]